MNTYLNVKAVAQVIAVAPLKLSPLLNRFQANSGMKDYTMAPGQRGVTASIMLMNRAAGDIGYTVGAGGPTPYKQIYTDIKINHIEKATRPIGLIEAATQKLPEGTPAHYQAFGEKFAEEASRTLAMRTEYDLTRHIFSTGVGFDIDESSEIIPASIKPVTNSGPLFYHGSADVELNNNILREALTHYDVQVGESFQQEIAIPPSMANQVSEFICNTLYADKFIDENLFSSSWAMGRLNTNQMIFKLVNNPLHLAGLDTGKDLTIKSVTSENGFDSMVLSGATASSAVENLNVGDCGTVLSGQGVSFYKVFGNVDSGYSPQFIIAESGKSNAAGEVTVKVRTNGSSLWTSNQSDQEVQLTGSVVGKKIRFEKSQIAALIYYNGALVMPTVPIPKMGGSVNQYTASAPGTNFNVQVTELVDDSGNSGVMAYKANIWYGAFIYGPMAMRLIGKIPAGLSAPVASAAEELEKLREAVRTNSKYSNQAQRIHEMREDILKQQEKHNMEIAVYKQQLEEMKTMMGSTEAQINEMKEHIAALTYKDKKDILKNKDRM